MFLDIQQYNNLTDLVTELKRQIPLGHGGLSRTAKALQATLEDIATNDKTAQRYAASRKARADKASTQEVDSLTDYKARKAAEGPLPVDKCPHCMEPIEKSGVYMAGAWYHPQCVLKMVD